MATINFSTANHERKYRHDISSIHLTTLSINDVKVTNIINVLKGDKISVDYSQFSRLSPLVAPTYGSFDIKTFSFFVPIHTIWHHYEQFKKSTVDSSISPYTTPINISLFEILREIDVDFFRNSDENVTPLYYHVTLLNGNNVSDLVSALSGMAVPPAPYSGTPAHDIIYYASNGDGTYWARGIKLTGLGRRVFNLFQSLGYGLPTLYDVTDVASSDSSQIPSYYTEERYSIYPLLALARVYYDYLYPSYYIEQAGYGYLFTDELYQKLFEIDRESAISEILDDIISLTMFNQYAPHFFTQLWQTPTEVVRGSQSNVTQRVEVSVGPDQKRHFDINSIKSGTSSNNSLVSAVVDADSSNSRNTLSASALRMLQAVADFALRNNLGGNRLRDYMREHMGYVTNDENSNYSQFLKVFSDSVSIQDVTNMTESSEAVLGQQAGKGYSGGQNRLNFESSSDGILLFVTLVEPKVAYWQGTKAIARAITDRFQLYTPEFDCVGMEAVPRSSVFSQYRDLSDVSRVPRNSLDEVFGFAPMYSDRYKHGNDFLTGDFLLRSRNTGLDSYHTFRDVLYSRNNLALDIDFLNIDNQTQRIFSYIGEDESTVSDSVSSGRSYDLDDKMFSFFSFNAVRYSSIKPLTQSLPLFDNDGRDVSMNYVGSGLKS